ncbi:hypothetical protein HRbin15_00582 [bacterium HR15]|nr:hypothetical protein HRbin15_00582 [bacterium HR15]
MMNRWLMACTAGAVLCASFAFADSRKSAELQLVDSGQIQRVMPKRMMKVRWENGRIVPVTPWIELGDFAPAGPCDPNETLVFDHFGTDDAGNPIGGSNCSSTFAPGTRWYFGPTYHNPYWANDIETLVDPQYNGATASSLTHAWFWNPGLTNPPSGSQQCIILILTVEAFDAECQDVHDVFDGNPFIDGVVLDYGVLNAGAGYYYSPVCLSAIGGIALPATPADDGDPGTELLGGWVVIYAQAYDPNTGAVTLASGAQPMLWSMQDAGNIGSSTPIQFDDDNPTDGNHTAFDECYDYTYSVCDVPPRVLGGMMAFWVSAPSCTPTGGDTTGEGCVDDSDILNILFAFGWTGNPGENASDVNCDGAVDDADLLQALFNFGTGC